MKGGCYLLNKRSKVTNSEIDQMVELYECGASAAAICEILPYTPHTILSHLRKRGVKIRNKAGFKEPFNENYFENIDTEKKAYFLGFLMADGCIVERKSSQTCIALQIKASDDYLLHELKKELSTKNTIGVNSRRMHSQLKIHSNKMANDLSKYGVIPRKTGKEIFPEDKIPCELANHFIRGFFDGDGWCTYTKSHGKPLSRICIGFTGNYKMMCHIRDYFIKHLDGITNLKIHEFSNLQKGYIGFSSVIFSKFSNVKNIRDFMYKDATIYLARKKDVLDEAITSIPSRRRIGRPRNAQRLSDMISKNISKSLRHA